MSTKEGDRPRPGDRLGTERFDAESGASGSGAGENGGAIRVVVVGNKGTGKTSLIISCLTEAFPEEPVPVLPPTRYLADSFSDKIPLLIVDTSSRREERGAVEAELRAADAVVITFACDDQASLNSVSSYWLPLLRQLQVLSRIRASGDGTASACASVSTRKCISSLALIPRPHPPPSSPALIPRPHPPPSSPALIPCPRPPLVPRPQVPVPVVVVGCKLDLRDAPGAAAAGGVGGAAGGAGGTGAGVAQQPLDVLVAPIMDEFKEVETCLECSALRRVQEAPYLGAAETSPSGALTFSGYLSLWSLMALLHPERAIEYLLYLGFPSDLAPSALTFTRRRRSDRKAGSSQRRVLQCFVVGPAQAGKTALLSSLLGRPFEHTHIKYGEDERFAVNLVSTDPQAHSASSSSASSASSSSTTTTPSSLSSNRDPSSIASQDLSVLASSSTVLVLREVHPDALPRLLARPDWLAACDVAAFVYDSSSQGSWEKAVGMLQEVAGRAEATESEMPAVLVAAKNDLEPHPAIFTQSAQLCTEMGVAAPVPVSSLLHDVNELWTRLTDAARKPHVGIPETSASRSSKALRKRLLYRSVSVALVGTAVAVVLVVGFRIYAARRSSST
ncbi:unnamed protein product [Closterium sp. NIES-54]